MTGSWPCEGRVHAEPAGAKGTSRELARLVYGPVFERDGLARMAPRWRLWIGLSLVLGAAAVACSLIPVINIPACSTPQCQLTTLAAGQSWPGEVAVDSTSVYWTTYYGAVMKVPLGGMEEGGVVATLASASNPSAVAVDDARVYWADLGNGSVASVPLDGGMASTLASGQAEANGIALDAVNVYWTNGGMCAGAGVTCAGDGGTVMSVPLDGGNVATLVAGQSGPFAVAVNATSVYWTDYNAGTVMKAPLDGGAPSTLASGQASPSRIAVDAANVYWLTSNGGTVMAVPLDGGTSVTLAAGQLYPSGIAVDGTSVYWTAKDDTVKKVAVDGGAVTTIATGMNGPRGIAVDGTSVYWANGGTSVNMFTDGTVVKLYPKK